jgi:hypothetical protein
MTKQNQGKGVLLEGCCYGSTLVRPGTVSLKNKKWETLAKVWPTHSSPPKNIQQKYENYYSLTVSLNEDRGKNMKLEWQKIAT